MTLFASGEKVGRYNCLKLVHLTLGRWASFSPWIRLNVFEIKLLVNVCCRSDLPWGNSDTNLTVSLQSLWFLLTVVLKLATIHDSVSLICIPRLPRTWLNQLCPRNESTVRWTNNPIHGNGQFADISVAVGFCVHFMLISSVGLVMLSFFSTCTQNSPHPIYGDYFPFAAEASLREKETFCGRMGCGVRCCNVKSSWFMKSRLR